MEQSKRRTYPELSQEIIYLLALTTQLMGDGETASGYAADIITRCVQDAGFEAVKSRLEQVKSLQIDVDAPKSVAPTVSEFTSKQLQAMADASGLSVAQICQMMIMAHFFSPHWSALMRRLLKAKPEAAIAPQPTSES